MAVVETGSFIFVLDNFVSTFGRDGLVSRVFRQQSVVAWYCSWVGLSWAL